MSTQDDPIDPSDDHLDAMARRAGAELRRPAPPGGVALVERSVRRRRSAAAVGGGLAVAALVAGGIALVGRGGGESVVSDDPVPTTIAPPPSVVGETTVPPGSVPQTTFPDVTTVPPDSAPETTVPPETTLPPETTAPVETTVPPTSTVVIAPSEPVVSEEVLPDPLAFAGDGFERVLDITGRRLIVGSDPQQVIPLDLPELELYLLGVGPNGVAYLHAVGDAGTRFLAVPTTGPTTGTVYELVEPYLHEGPWLGFMLPEGISPGSIVGGPGILPYVGPDGLPLDDPIDPTFTWRTEYRLLDDGSGMVQPYVVDPSGTAYALPVTEPGREGQFDRHVRPLPDGRVTLHVLLGDGTNQVWAFDPATSTWSIHPPV